MRPEISKAFAGQGKQGNRLGMLLSQTCCLKQSSARLLVVEGLLIRTGIQMARRKGFSFQAAIVTLPSQGMEPCLLRALPAHTEQLRTAWPLWHRTLVWYLPGAAEAVTLQHTCLPGHQLQATCKEHPRDEHSSELREGPEP